MWQMLLKYTVEFKIFKFSCKKSAIHKIVYPKKEKYWTGMKDIVMKLLQSTINQKLFVNQL